MTKFVSRFPVILIQSKKNVFCDDDDDDDDDDGDDDD